MFSNYLKIAWRNISRNKAFSTINILGLALGMACSLLIMLWVRDERSIDGFHANGDRLYQVYERNYYDGKVHADYPTQALLAGELKRVIPEIKYASSLEWNTTSTFEAGDKISKMDGSFAGTDFFTMFSYPLLQGTPKTALTTVGDIAISRKMADYFAGLAIFISCLGLLGLAAFTAEQRTKEIGVRKVLGAKVSAIVALLSRDFLQLVLIAIVIASPVAWYFMHRWLQDFAYRVPISAWIFVVAGGLALLIAFATISFQAVRAAVANPIKSLRTE
jgi:ABC-type antimicrobial peptide transport system permease subunit